jgi:hypothetical protein
MLSRSFQYCALTFSIFFLNASNKAVILPPLTPATEKALTLLPDVDQERIVAAEEVRASNGDVVAAHLYARWEHVTKDVCVRQSFTVRLSVHPSGSSDGGPFTRFREIEVAPNCSYIVNTPHLSIEPGDDLPSTAEALQYIYDVTVAVQQRVRLRGLRVTCVRVVPETTCPARAEDLLAVLPLQGLFEINSPATTTWRLRARSNYGSVWTIDLDRDERGRHVIRLSEDFPPPF